MKIKSSTPLLVAAVFLSGCGTMTFIPKEHPLRDGVIPALSISGDVKMSNGQMDAGLVAVYLDGVGGMMASNYREITQLMVDQAVKELIKNTRGKKAGTPKAITLKVTYLRSEEQFMWWKSELRYVATLGDSDKIEKMVRHGSGDLRQDLNGCVADAVVDLLKDPKVTAYLAE